MGKNATLGSLINRWTLRPEPVTTALFELLSSPDLREQFKGVLKKFTGEDKNVLLSLSKELFGDEGEIGVYFAPGRVNMIGEHTDYNGGHVFPCALTIGTYGVARKRNDNKRESKQRKLEENGLTMEDQKQRSLIIGMKLLHFGIRVSLLLNKL